MASRRKPSTKRSLSLRSSSFIRLISPFRGSRSTREGAESPPPSPREGGALHGALSDSHLASWDKRRTVEHEAPWVSTQELQFKGPASVPPWTSQQNLATPRCPGTGTLLRRQNASWANAAAEAAWARTKGAALLGRSAVSYQNIGPTGELFGATSPVQRGQARAREGFCEENKNTTNVAWLVGSNRRGEEADHHIDIPDQGDLQPPSHLAVAPILPASPRLGVKALGGNKVPSSSSDTPSPPTPTTQQAAKQAPIRQAGYTLARSSTVSDLPFWAHKDPTARDERSSSSSERLFTRGPTSQATVSTLGSLKSKIVRHKTLLGSSSRLYKFSQSLSSLTTITSGDSRTSTLSRDAGETQAEFR